MFMNIASNMLGLDNAATPTGLKAMAQLQELNPKKDTATNPMIMFLVLNTSGLTIIPTTILAFRASYGAAMPTDVFIPILLSTTIATLAGIVLTLLWQKTSLLQPALLATLGCIMAFVGLLIWGFGRMDKDTMATVTSVGSNLILLSVIVSFILAGLWKRVNVYDASSKEPRKASRRPCASSPISWPSSWPWASSAPRGRWTWSSAAFAGAWSGWG